MSEEIDYISEEQRRAVMLAEWLPLPKPEGPIKWHSSDGTAYAWGDERGPGCNAIAYCRKTGEPLGYGEDFEEWKRPKSRKRRDTL